MTSADVSEVVTIHIAAFPSFFLTSLGRAFLSYYYREFPNTAGTIALVAESTNRDTLLGFCVGTRNPRGFYRGLLRRRWIGFAVRATFALLRNPNAAPRLLRGLRHPSSNPDGSGVAGLFSIAVAPSAQGSAVGTALLETFVQRAAGAGATSVFLLTDVVANERANDFYRRHGFSVRRTVTTPEGRRLHEYWRTIASTVGAEPGP
jgi:ribosomal protein S18 acetylase RimI-like enzyme